MFKKLADKTILIWVMAVVITLLSVVYQRMTGPTHPLSGSVIVNNETIDYKLLRSHNTDADAVMELVVSDTTIKAGLRLRRINSDDPWNIQEVPRVENKLIVAIPKQPSAGKVAYKVVLIDQSGKTHSLTEEPVVIRFKDPVPATVLIPHIILMFSAMLLSTRTGLEALFKRTKMLKLALLSAVLLFLGGLIMGPIVQKYAFGAYWTGWPFGNDLTDNKTAAAMIFWLIAIWRIHKTGKGYGWVIAASLVTLIIYIIPHSVLGSELDYQNPEQLG